MSAPYRGTTVIMRPRRRRRRRSPWAVVAVAVAVIAVAAGAVGGIVLLASGGEDEPAAAASGTPAPCTTMMVIPVVQLPEAGSVRVNVYNATRKAGLAAATAMELEARGFQVRKVANDPTGARVDGVAEIRYGPAAEDGAKLVAYQFPGARMILVGRTGKRVDIALGDAFTAMPTVADVAAALASPSPSASGPGCADGPSLAPVPGASPVPGPGEGQPGTALSPSPAP